MGIPQQGGLKLAFPSWLEFGAKRRERDGTARGPAAFDAFARKIAKALAIGGLRTGLEREFDRLDLLQRESRIDRIGEFIGKLTRNELVELVDRIDQGVDPFGGLGVLVHAIAEAELVHALADFEK